MAKLWEGRSLRQTAAAADGFNSSIGVDGRMFREDIAGSLAHAAMLAAKGIIPEGDAEKIMDGLEAILADLESGALKLDPGAEDIHMFVEAELTKRSGEAGKRLHTARSRNDQVAADTRLYLRRETEETAGLIKDVIRALTEKAERHKTAIMPGYTHLQRAQPVTFAHHLLAYGMMRSRDLGRLRDAAGRMNVSPLGACALAGTTYGIDQAMTAGRLGFGGVCLNSLDAVSDRDFCVELASALALVMAHLSRLAEELILWTSWEFRFIELDEAYATGSSLMPQKKNPDMAELIRGRTGRVYGNLVALLTVLKGLPLAYNKDMQEDKEPLFDTVDTVKGSLKIFADMVREMKVKAEVMREAAARGFSNATDVADYLVRTGMPFREAHEVVGKSVRYCIEHGKRLEELSMDQWKSFSERIGPDIYDAITLEASVNARRATGGTALERVKAEIERLKREREKG